MDLDGFAAIFDGKQIPNKVALFRFFWTRYVFRCDEYLALYYELVDSFVKDGGR